MKLALLFLFATTLLVAQTTHSATITWADALNPAAGTTYSVYRAFGLCSGSPMFSKIATALTVKTYNDATVLPGNYCYTVTATVGGMESSQGTAALAPVPSFAPSSIAVTVQ